MYGHRILVADDTERYRHAVEVALLPQGYEVLTASSGAETLRQVEQGKPDLLLLDLRMPDLDGLEVLARAKDLQPDLLVIIMAAHGTVEQAAQAMKEGAHDVIAKPFELGHLRLVVEKAAEYFDLLHRNRYLPDSLRRNYPDLIGSSPPMMEVLNLLERVAPTSANVLILGETGTGKELLARAVHQRSPRAAQPFVPLNCAAIPEPLLESELFGHERGAFTDAVSMQIGKFQLADGGTLFLDEIGDMSLSLQAKLLRVLETQAFERLGGTRTIQVDVRVIAATHRDLTQHLRQGTFREDLFYRLNVFPIAVPPLRERGEDLELLAYFFLDRFARRHGKNIRKISPAALRLLKRHDWPGNVRELENRLERAVIMADGDTLLPLHLPPPLRPAAARGGHALPVGLTLAELERRFILQTLERCGGNRTEAAQSLGISLRGLQYKLKRYAEDNGSPCHSERSATE
jgi:two-component system NtrC family response regulator